MQKAALSVFRTQTLHEFGRVATLGWPQCLGVPLGAVALVDGDEGRLAALRQTHVARQQIRVHHLPERKHVLPLLFRVGLGHTRRFIDARHVHRMRKLDLAFVDQPFHRRRAHRLRRASERNVPFAGQQAGRRVEADPARARQVDLAPGVQVGEIHFGAARAVERFDVGLELDQVARCEARGEPQMAAYLHQQPAAIAA